MFRISIKIFIFTTGMLWVYGTWVAEQPLACKYLLKKQKKTRVKLEEKHNIICVFFGVSQSNTNTICKEFPVAISILSGNWKKLVWWQNMMWIGGKKLSLTLSAQCFRVKESNPTQLIQ